MKAEHIKTQAIIDLETAVAAENAAEQQLKQARENVQKAAIVAQVEACPPAWYNTLNSPLLTSEIDELFPNVEWQEKLRRLAKLIKYRYYVVNHQIYVVDSGQPTGIWVKNYGFTKTPQ